jgi:hypothetical protein
VEDYHKRSCCKNSIGVSVPRPCGSDLYLRVFEAFLTVFICNVFTFWSAIKFHRE